jgi:hypothetical protein
MKTLRAIGIVFLLLLVIGWVWYCIAANYDYSAVSGTYYYQGDGVTSTLVLKEDRSFQQELTQNGKIEHAHGSWRRIAEAGVAFSKDFLIVPGQEIRPTGERDGYFDKSWGLFLWLALDPEYGGPIFHKKLFR